MVTNRTPANTCGTHTKLHVLIIMLLIMYSAVCYWLIKLLLLRSDDCSWNNGFSSDDCSWNNGLRKGITYRVKWVELLQFNFWIKYTKPRFIPWLLMKQLQGITNMDRAVMRKRMKKWKRKRCVRKSARPRLCLDNVNPLLLLCCSN